MTKSLLSHFVSGHTPPPDPRGAARQLPSFRRRAGCAPALALLAAVRAFSAFGAPAPASDDGPLELPGTVAITLANPSFEDGMADGVPAGWRAYKRASDTRSRKLVQTSSGASLLLSDGDQREEIGVRQQFPLLPGRFYQLTASVRAAAAGRRARDAYLQLRFLPSNELGQVSLHADSADDPVAFTTSAMAPADTTHGVVYIYTNRAATPTIVIDEVRLTGAPVNTFAEITEPKRNYPETVCVENRRARCAIVTPDAEEWRQLGRELAEHIASRTGATVPVKAATDPGRDELAASTAIVLGNIANNRALLYPYSHSLVFADEIYPGPGGYDLRTVHDPWGTGRNLISVGASDLAGAKKALALLKARMSEGAELRLEPILETSLTGPARARWQGAFDAKLDAEWVEARKSETERAIVRGIHGGVFSLAVRAGRNYALTRRAPYAERFVRLIRRAQTLHDSKPTTYGGPWGMDSDFRIYTIIPAWDAVEECPTLSPADRLDVTRILFRWVSDLDHKGRARGRQVRFNHITFPALGCLYAGQYFERYYGILQGKLWIRQADVCFRFQARTTKPHCDCNSYQWLTIRHTARYALARGDLAYFENGNLRTNIDYAILTMNNLGYQVPYGDVGGWTCGSPTRGILEMAQWFYRDPGIAWLITRKDRIRRRLDLGSFNTDPGPGLEPTYLAGMQVWPVTEPWYDTFRKDGDPPRADTFDKIAFRSGFDPRDDYLLLDGLNRGGHGHMDGNSILQWTQNGRIWLADTDYIKSLPKFHNTVLVLRDGQTAPIPAFCELRNAADLGEVAVTRSTLRNYAGVDWSRYVIWLKGQYFVVIDRMTAIEAGDYSFRAVWQTVGEAALNGSALDIVQDGQHARIAMTPDTRLLLHDDAAQGKNWRGYPHADEPTVRVLQGVMDARLAVGQSAELATVLHTDGGRPSAVAIERVSGGLFTITRTGRDPMLVGLPGPGGLIEIPGVAKVRAAVFVLTPRQSAAADLREAIEPVSALYRTPVDAQIDLMDGRVILTQPAHVQAEQETEERTDWIDITATPEEVIGIIEDFSLRGDGVGQTRVPGAGLPEIPVEWTFENTPGKFLISGNRGRFGGLNAGLKLTAVPDPLPANVFSGEPGRNSLRNMLDGQLQGTSGATMWGDDEEVTLTLEFGGTCRVRRVRLAVWFATTSSKGKRFQLGRTRILASRDGFATDTRLLADRGDEEQYPSWGTPVFHEFDGLDAEIEQLRIVLTPRPGTAVYVAELEVWADGPWLAERYRRSAASRGDSLVLHSADCDGDGDAEVLLGTASGQILCLDSAGRERWRHEYGAPVNAITSAAFDQDDTRTVVAGGMGGRLLALRPDGTMRWEYAIPDYKGTGHIRTLFPAVLDPGGRQVVVAGADNWRYHVLDGDGRKRWHYESVHSSTAGAAVDLDGDGRQELILGTAYYTWPCVNPDGTRRWSHRTAGGPGANAVAAADVDGDGRPEIFFGGEDALVQAVDARGKLMWTFNAGDEVTALAAADADGDDRLDLLVSSLSFNVYALKADGSRLWRTDLGAPVVKLAAGTGGTSAGVAAACRDGTIWLLDPRTGIPIRILRLGARPADMTIADGLLLVGDSRGRVTALNMDRGD